VLVFADATQEKLPASTDLQQIQEHKKIVITRAIRTSRSLMARSSNPATHPYPSQFGGTVVGSVERHP
jgi:hypothetical protein